MSLAVLLGLDARAAVFVVNSASDTSDAIVGNGVCGTGVLLTDPNGNQVVECTLRAAIEEANFDGVHDTIEFTSALLFGAPNGTVTLTPATDYPSITQPLDVDGRTAPSWHEGGSPRVIIVGSNGFGTGLEIGVGAGGSRLLGLGLLGFDYGVAIYAAGDVWIDACAFGYVRTAPPGASERVDGNTIGVIVAQPSPAGSAHIGMKRVPGPLGVDQFEGQGNVMSANTGSGVVIFSPNVTVVGNRIGTDHEGTATQSQLIVPSVPLGNFIGITLWSTAGVEIGDAILGDPTLPAGAANVRGNVISGNDYGIFVSEVGPGLLEPLRIVGNAIGTDATGGTRLPGTLYGVYFLDTTGLASGSPIVIGTAEAPNRIIVENDGVYLNPTLRFPVTLHGNEFGVLADPTTDAGFMRRAIHAQGGGDLIIEANTIGGQLVDAVEVNGTSSAPRAVSIFDNWVGMTADGIALANTGSGIRIVAGSDDVVTIDGNRVGHSDPGIAILGNTQSAEVTNNYLGTDETGADHGNRSFGIEIATSVGGHRIGRPGAGNVIGWNQLDGVSLEESLDPSRIQANRVGLDGSGNPTPNGRHGVAIRDTTLPLGATHYVGAFSTTELESAGNWIAFNASAGVSLEDGTTASVRLNRMRENQGLAIDLDNDGPTVNDPGDLDIGANRLQNHPELNAANSFVDPVTGELQVRYRVESAPTESDYPLRVDFYLADESGAEPRTWVGGDEYVSAEAGFPKTIAFAPANPIGPTDLLISTATDLEGRTSEVSPPVFVPEPVGASPLLIGALGLLGLRRWAESPSHCNPSASAAGRTVRAWYALHATGSMPPGDGRARALDDGPLA